jgi:hypothetical protein
MYSDAVPPPLRRLFRQALFTYGRLSARLGPSESPWERVEVDVPPLAFGPGSDHGFAYYLEGQSAVPVDSIEAMVEWLLGCEYASDPDVFHQRDVWQHPIAFESRRCGDCEDFALWAWRKFAELRVDAEFFVGRLLDRRGAGRQHAWVVYRREGAEFLFEPAAGDRARMIRGLPDVRDEYVPHFAVDHHGRTAAFGGYILDERERERQSRRN